MPDGETLEIDLEDFGDRAVAGGPRVVAADALWRRLRALRDHGSLSQLVHTLILDTRQAWLQARLAPGGRGAMAAQACAAASIAATALALSSAPGQPGSLS